MKNTDYSSSVNTLGSFLSSDASYQALKDLIDEFGLEVEAVTSL